MTEYGTFTMDPQGEILAVAEYGTFTTKPLGEAFYGTFTMYDSPPGEDDPSNPVTYEKKRVIGRRSETRAVKLEVERVKLRSRNYYYKDP